MVSRHRCLALLPLFFILITTAFGQDDNAYKMPPKDIADLLLAKSVPNTSISDKGEWILFTETRTYPSVEELAKPEFKIAGLRLNPANFAPSRQNLVYHVYLKNIRSGKEFTISGLPAALAAGNFSWSPNDQKIAFTQVNKDRVDLYVIDVNTHKAMKVNKTALNIVTGQSFQWYDDHSLLYRVIVKPASAAPPKLLAPKGPTTQENYGKASPRPTFQDLIKSPYDEQVFEFFGTSQLVKNTNGIETRIGQPAIYNIVSVSPDKKYLMLRTINKPYSYSVTVQNFPSTVVITDMNGRLVKQLVELPSGETAPSGNDNVQPVARGFDWSDDQAATVIWCMPLDSGLIRKKMDYHDVVYSLSAPFTSEPTEIFKTKMRYRFTTWGTSNFALVTEGLTGKQSIQLNLYDPSSGKFEKLLDRNTTDAYSNPGVPIMEKNQYGREVIKLIENGTRILMNNTTGSSPSGDMPFIASFDLAAKKSHILWRSNEDCFEYVAKILDADKLEILTRKESEKEVPNYWIKNLRATTDDHQVTQFKDPFPQLEGVSKQKIFYKRADGVDLTGDLYLPKGYDKKRDGKLPAFIWAYPAEYNSAADAAQVRGSEHKFPTISWGSAIFYVTQGYAVLNNAEMPIVATGKEKKPNDNFVEQLTMNAEAAINMLDSIGVGDKNRVAVGGHSYGAFMTANLLAHTKLFKAGIARSGAYNRSLTPFGFQNEDRTYWEAPELYNDMSPFMSADKIKTPILLVHGEMDNNTGTFPIQSERLFSAIKGTGGTVKFISLPYESHGYQGRENILHMLYEQGAWLDKYVKNAEKKPAAEVKKAF